MALFETKCSTNKAEKNFKSNGFHRWHCVKGNGFAGGIWFAWKEDFGAVSIVKDHPQFIHAKISHGRFEWWLTTIYAAPRMEERKELWQ